MFEGDTTVPTLLFTVQVYNPSSVLLRLVIVKVEVARPTALGLVIVTLPPCVMMSEPFVHVTVATGFPSYSQLRVTLSFSFLVSLAGFWKIFEGSVKTNFPHFYGINLHVV